MSYARRTSRVEVQCKVMVTLGSGESILGELVDLSPTGAGLLFPHPPGRFPKGMPMELLIEAPELPDPEGDGPVISLRATVASTRAHALPGSTRIGVRFLVEARDLRARLAGLGPARLACGTGSGTALGDRGSDGGGDGAGSSAGERLGASAQGREQLYQRALTALVKTPQLALDLVRAARRGDLANPAYAVLEHVALGAIAIAAGDRLGARRELEAARNIDAGSPELARLAAKVPAAAAEPAAKKRLFARLLGR